MSKSNYKKRREMQKQAWGGDKRKTKPNQSEVRSKDTMMSASA